MRGIGTVEKEKWILDTTIKDGSVLHVGCTNAPNMLERIENGSLLHEKLLKINGDVVGLDIDSHGIEHLKGLFPSARLVCGDAHALNDVFDDTLFDQIIAGDVIEHLDDPGTFLRSCWRQLSSEGELLITTVSAFSVIRFAKSLFFHEAVHDEHTAYYSPSTLARMGQMNGFVIKLHGYYRSEPVLKFSLNRYASNFLEGAATVIWPQMSEGVIVVMKKC
jgi:2-polyprenyl-3-methyl-5-hydroxy-6-metoxy-1,4-benzoquinol methylase